MFSRDMYYFWLHVGDEYNFLQAAEIVLFHQCHLSLRLAFYAQENAWKKLRLTPMKCPCKKYCWVSFTPKKNLKWCVSSPTLTILKSQGRAYWPQGCNFRFETDVESKSVFFQPTLSNGHMKYEVNIFKASDAELMHSFSDASSYQILGLQSQQFHWSQGSHLGCGMTQV